MDAIQERWLQVLAIKAKNALTQPGFETQPGYCERWVRQVVQSCGGAGAWPCPAGLDAAGCYDWFASKHRVMPVSGGSLPGDILYFVGPGHGRHGHVVIRIFGNEVAENSSVHVGGSDRDARGVRTLSMMGRPSGIVRLPAPTK